jgi:hypothetical protein
MREEYRMIVFDSRELRRNVYSKSEGVTGQGKKLHSEELSDLYISPNIFGDIKTRRNATNF